MDVVVIHDDLDIVLGEYKIQKGVGPKVHNGVSSVEQVLGEKGFIRVRIGVDNRKGDRNISGEDYVLSRWRAEEARVIEKVVAEVVVEVKKMLE